MAATKISDYAIGGSNWTELLTTIEKQRKGYNGVSLTNYDNNSLPAIAAGSYFEISGSLYGFTSEEAITGTPSSENINYIYINGTTFVPVWTTTAPTWSDAKNGWYDAGETHRYVAGCYYDGTNYKGKSILKKRDDIREEYIYLPLSGYTQKPLDFHLTGGQVEITSSADTSVCSFQAFFPNNSLIEEFSAQIKSDGTQTIWVTLYAEQGGNMAQVSSASSDSTLVTDSSITLPFVDVNQYGYYFTVHISNTPSAFCYVYSVRVKYIKLKTI